MPPLRPLRAIGYGALPCTEKGCGKVGRATGLPSEDMMQEGYELQWGASGRNDLGMMAKLGANAIRLYHSLGLRVQRDHSGFLDRAQSLSLNVMPGYHTNLAIDPTECPAFDCFEAWKLATLQGFEFGFKKGSDWHPAVAALILLNEPDFFETQPKCVPAGPWCRVKAALSALDGVLAAEREAGVAAGSVKLTVTWSFALRESIDGVVTGPGVFGFQDMVAGIKDPSIAHYVPRSSHEDMKEAFKTRWMHGVNTQSPWGFVSDAVSKEYNRFLPTPWFIGEYGGNGQTEHKIRSDLWSMQQTANDGGAFIGAAFFQFQTAHWKGGAEMNYGLFGLGSQQIGSTGLVCDRVAKDCKAWPVQCLTTDLTWLPGAMALRAKAVAEAWGGEVDEAGLCGHRRLDATVMGAKLSCRIRGGGERAASINSALSGSTFVEKLERATKTVLGQESSAVVGELRLESSTAKKVEPIEQVMPVDSKQGVGLALWGALLGVALMLLAMSAAIFFFCKRKGRNGTQEQQSSSRRSDSQV
jgi:hypothetical protein